MFCPEGYNTIQEIRRSVIGYQWQAQANSNLTSADVFENLVFDTIIEKKALRLCSPEGTIFKISDDILDRVDLPEEIDIENFPDNFFYDFLAGKLSSLRWSTIPLYFERQYYTISLNAYRHLKKVTLPTQREEESQDDLGFGEDSLWSIAERFEGYSLCAVSELMPLTITNCEGLFEKITTNKPGRPTHRKKIREFYNNYFPEGHTTWKQVQRTLLESMEIDVHTDTIKRALGKK